MPVSWDLVADIGGTNARFSAFAKGDLTSTYEFHHSVREYPAFSQLIDILREEIARVTGWASPPQRVCLAVACPPDTDMIRFTNSHWEFSREQLMAAFQCRQVSLINDFEAVAHGVTELQFNDRIQIGGDAPRADKPVAILGAGTGLGVAALVPSRGGYHVVDTEGGHVDFAPNNALQMAVLEHLLKQYPRVSLERVLSGVGLVNIYSAIAKIRGKTRQLELPAEVVSEALEGTDAVAEETLSLFCDVLGSAAGNLALTYGARGGVYIAGGVVPRFQDFLLASSVRSAFENKGRFSTYLNPIPIFLVTRANLGLLGAAKKLQRDEELIHA